MADIFKQALGDVVGGRVLDVATGRGGFIGVLQRCLKDYTEIVGIDVYERAIQAARDAFSAENVRFIRMDTERLGFRDQSFDVVNVSKSLHHLANVPAALSEMKRVLKSGGRLVVSDMYRNAHTEAQFTDVYIHHWGAKVNTLQGFIHNETFARQELVEFVKGLGLANIVSYDRSDTDSDPMDAEAMREKEELIDRILQHAKQVSDCQALVRRGEELRQRLYDTGIQSEPVLVIVGEKQ